jgi:hypothetical protein
VKRHRNALLGRAARLETVAPHGHPGPAVARLIGQIGEADFLQVLVAGEAAAGEVGDQL